MFSTNEFITYDALGLCPPGCAADLVRNNDNTYGGKYVVNPSGGLISKGHPLGATGIAQCAELCWQLRGEAGKRQVSNVRYGLQHNIGLGGAAIVGVYRLGFGNASPPTSAAANLNSQGANENSNSNNTTTGSFKNITSQHKSGKFFEEIEAKLKEEGASMVSKVNATIGFIIQLPDKKTVSYVVNLEKAPGSVLVNDGSKYIFIIVHFRFNFLKQADANVKLKGVKPSVTITINDEDLLNIMDGKLNMMSVIHKKLQQILCLFRLQNDSYNL
jgi:sterol carrier protein 2